MEAYYNAPKMGLNTLLEGKKMHEWAKIFLEFSIKGLKKKKRTK